MKIVKWALCGLLVTWMTGCVADGGDGDGAPSETVDQTQDELVVGRTFRLRGPSNMCLDGYDNNGANAYPYLYACTAGNLYQLWKAIGPEGKQQICNVGSGRCLDGFGNVGSGRIRTYTYTPQSTNPYQMWKTPASGVLGGTVYANGQISNGATGFCLTTGSWTSGAPIYTVPCSGAVNWLALSSPN